MTLLITIGLAAGCILVGLIHRQLARLAPAWPGAVVPALWAGAAVYLAVSGSLDSLVDVGGIVLVTVVLARIWHEGRQHRLARSAPSPVEA
jgi:hypothetical protein